MMTTILIAICLLAASLTEAIANFGIIGTSWGAEETQTYKTSNRIYHRYFFAKWALLFAAVLLTDWRMYPIVMMYAVYRLTIFNWFLNFLIGKNFVDGGRPIWHLSDNGMDGWIKAKIGEHQWFLISLGALMLSIAIFILFFRA